MVIWDLPPPFPRVHTRNFRHASRIHCGATCAPSLGIGLETPGHMARTPHSPNHYNILVLMARDDYALEFCIAMRPMFCWQGGRGAHALQ